MTVIYFTIKNSPNKYLKVVCWPLQDLFPKVWRQWPVFCKTSDVMANVTCTVERKRHFVAQLLSGWLWRNGFKSTHWIMKETLYGAWLRLVNLYCQHQTLTKMYVIILKGDFCIKCYKLKWATFRDFQVHQSSMHFVLHIFMICEVAWRQVTQGNTLDEIYSRIGKITISSTNIILVLGEICWRLRMALFTQKLPLKTVRYITKCATELTRKCMVYITAFSFLFLPGKET